MSKAWETNPRLTQAVTTVQRLPHLPLKANLVNTNNWVCNARYEPYHHYHYGRRCELTRNLCRTLEKQTDPNQRRSRTNFPVKTTHIKLWTLKHQHLPTRLISNYHRKSASNSHKALCTQGLAHGSRSKNSLRSHHEQQTAPTRSTTANKLQRRISNRSTSTPLVPYIGLRLRNPPENDPSNTKFENLPNRLYIYTPHTPSIKPNPTISRNQTTTNPLPHPPYLQH